jgi:diadenylate cyclase
MKPPALLSDVGVSDVADILLMTLLIYSLLVLLKKTKRAALVLTGIVIVALVYLSARQFNLMLTVAVLQGFFAVILVALVVIFQEELRHFFEQIAQWSLGRNLSSKRVIRTSPKQVEIIVRTLADLSDQRIGALLVLRGRDLLVRHLDGGETLHGEVSESVLKSVFDPHSIGHDGAVVLEGDLIERFGCHLPLSKNRELLGHDGTRHAAALGLSERSDALCLVVSEERGTISVARHGTIHVLATEAAVRSSLIDFFTETTPERGSGFFRRFLTRNAWEKLIAAGLAMTLWFVLVHESALVYRSFPLPVSFAHLPPHLRITRVDPSEIEITVSAPRKSMYFVKQKNVELAVRAWDLEPGTTRVLITSSDVSLPRGVVLENIKPREVEIEVDAGPIDEIAAPSAPKDELDRKP